MNLIFKVLALNFWFFHLILLNINFEETEGIQFAVPVFEGTHCLQSTVTE